MSITTVMTKKEREAGELKRHDDIQMLLIEIRILNRFNNGSSLVKSMITKKSLLLNDLWAAGDDKYTYDINDHAKEQ